MGDKRMASPIATDTVDLRFYWRQMRRHPWLILMCMVVSLVIGSLYIAKQEPLYRATAKVLIERETAHIAPFQELVSPGQTESHYETQYEVLKSRAVARRVIDAVGLRTHAEFAPQPPEESWLNGLSKLWGQWIGQPEAAVNARLHETAVTKMMDAPLVADHAYDPDSAMIDEFLNRLRVNSHPKTHLVSVSFDAQDPALAAEVPNTLVQLYIDFNMETRFASLQEALDWLKQQVGDVRQDVEQSENLLQVYKDEHDAHLIDVRLPNLIQELTELGSELNKAQAERIELETLYASARRAMRQNKTAIGIQGVVDNRLIQSLKIQYANQVQKMNELELALREQHPRVLELKAQVEGLEAQIDSEVQSIVDSIRTQYVVVKAREQTLQDRVDALEGEVAKLSKTSVQYGILKREAESNQRLSDLLLNRLKEASVSSDLSGGDKIRVIDQAEVPEKSINSNPKLIIGLAGMVGLVVGVSFVAFIGFLDNSLKTPDEIEDFIGLTVMGVIERFREKQGMLRRSPTHALVTFNAPHSRAAEAFKKLRANLHFSYADPPRKVFLVTSSHPNEGKTTIAANLAVVLSQLEQRVLLIDADFRHPSMHQLFELDGKKHGLSELLLHETYDGLLGEPHEAGPTVVVAGELPPNPSELLASKRLQQFLDYARAHYDAIIIDSPPLLAVSDAMVISALADSMLLVIRAGATPYDHIRQAIAPYLTQGHGEDEGTSSAAAMSMGAVMNFLPPSEGTAYGYYGYHQYYYYGQQKD